MQYNYAQLCPCLQLLKQEMAKPKPRVEVLKELMARTFSSRREWILDTTSVRSVKDITAEFPLLKKSIYVSDLIVANPCS